MDVVERLLVLDRGIGPVSFFSVSNQEGLDRALNIVDIALLWNTKTHLS